MTELRIGTFFVTTDVDPEYPETTGGSCDYPCLLEAMTEYEDARERIALGTCANAAVSVTVYDTEYPGEHIELTLHSTDVDNERRLRAHLLGDGLR